MKIDPARARVNVKFDAELTRVLNPGSCKVAHRVCWYVDGIYVYTPFSCNANLNFYTEVHVTATQASLRQARQAKAPFRLVSSKPNGSVGWGVCVCVCVGGGGGMCNRARFRLATFGLFGRSTL